MTDALGNGIQVASGRRGRPARQAAVGWEHSRQKRQSQFRGEGAIVEVTDALGYGVQVASGRRREPE